MLYDLDRFQADGNDLPDQPNNVLFIVEVVGVIDDAAALVRFDPVLVDEASQMPWINLNSSSKTPSALRGWRPLRGIGYCSMRLHLTFWPHCWSNFEK